MKHFKALTITIVICLIIGITVLISVFSNSQKRIYIIPYTPDFTKTYGDFEVAVTDNLATITKYNGLESDVVIPDTFDGYSVIAIGFRAFDNCKSLKTVEMPDSIATISRGAFSSCDGLTSVQIPNSVTTIDDYAFENCINLKNVEIPASVISLSNEAFFSCDSLESINVSRGNKYYCDDEGVLYSKDMKILIIYPRKKDDFSYTIPYGVTTIYDRSFFGCSNLISVNIPNSVTTIGENAFFLCYNLNSIKLPNSITTVRSQTFYYCENLKSVELPNSITTIEYEAFRSCGSLKHIDLPKSVTTIGESAFYDCISLESLELSDSITEIGPRAFSDCPNLTVKCKQGTYAEEYVKTRDIPIEYID